MCRRHRRSSERKNSGEIDNVFLLLYLFDPRSCVSCNRFVLLLLVKVLLLVIQTLLSLSLSLLIFIYFVDCKGRRNSILKEKKGF